MWDEPAKYLGQLLVPSTVCTSLLPPWLLASAQGLTLFPLWMESTRKSPCAQNWRALDFTEHLMEAAEEGFTSRMRFALTFPATQRPAYWFPFPPSKGSPQKSILLLERAHMHFTRLLLPSYPLPFGTAYTHASPK